MLDDSVQVLFTAINEFTTKSISFSYQAYQDVYKFISSNSVENIIEKLQNQIITHFTDFINEIYQNNCITPFARFSTVSKEFVRYKKIIINLFSIIERFAITSFSLNCELNQIFIDIFRSLTNFDELLLSFFEKLDSFHFADFNLDHEFEDLILISKLIHFSYSEKEKRKIFYELLFKETQNSAQNFIDETIDLDIIEYINSLNRYLSIENSLLYNLFYKEIAESALTNVYNLFINFANSSLFEKAKQQIKESCEKRDKSFIIKYYKFISFRAPSECLLTSLSETIHEQLKNESIEKIIELGKTVSFYDDLFSTMKNSILTNRYNRQIIQFINNKKKEIFKDLISFISKVATSNPDITPIKPILARIESKYEFEIIYRRHVTKRIVPPTEKQIERENSIISQIQSIPTTSPFEFSKLSQLLKEAAQSIERHIGSVLICNISVWPFQPPFPKCSYFDSICSDIQTKYSKLNPNRILTFPFDSWVVCVKNNHKNYIMSGNAVQAEVFLFLNTHGIIHKDSFSPRVSSIQMTSVLKSLSSKKMKLLIEKENINEITYFALNSEFKNKAQTFKLPTPALVQKTAQKDVAQAKNELIDATITKLMKEKRMMKYGEMESEVKERMSSRMSVGSDEVKSRVNELVAREFLKINEEENTVVYLP